jgi:hypothetical protein
MVILDATTKLIEAVLDAAPAANQLHFVASWADMDATTFTPGATSGLTSSTTPVTVVAAPASATQRQVKFLSIFNADTSNATVTIRLDTAGTDRTLWRGTLAPGEAVQFVDRQGFTVLDSAGVAKQTTAFNLAGLTPPAYQHVNGGSSLSRYMVAGLANATALTTGAPAVGTLRALPWVAPAKPGTIDQLAFAVTTLLAGNGRIGLYRNIGQGNLYPAALVADSGSISTVTTGVKTFSINHTYEPGALYWLTYESDSAATLRCLALANCWPINGLDTGLGTAPGVGISVARTYAALPTPFPTGGAVITAVPLPALAVRIAT